MTEHLGGPESHEQIVRRQARYEALVDSGTAGIFRIVDVASGADAGGVLYWERTWREAEVFEIGWAVLPEFQGRGIARRATVLALDRARAEGRRRFVHAFPSVDNAPSNAICRRLGFTLLGPLDSEYPPGNPLRVNDWRYDLHAGPEAQDAAPGA
jgi:RimJ/RimL family protein N-acetyltransferase